MVDFIKLENNLRKAYGQYNKQRSQKRFAALYIAINELAYKTLMTTRSWNKFNVDMEEVSLTYTLYLIDRIVTNKFIPKAYYNNNFPWTRYIRLNVRNVLYGMVKFPKTEEITDSLKETLPEFISTEEDELITNTLVTKFVLYMKMFYGERFYELANLLLSSKVDKIIAIKDPELRMFSKTALIIHKRIYEYYDSSVIGSNMSNVLNSTLYLATLLSSEKDSRLFMSLDITNLYRLSLMFGGEVIKIPYLYELEELVATARITYEMFMSTHDTSLKEAAKKVKDNFSVHIRSDTLNKNVKKLLEYLHTNIIDKPSVDLPLVDSLSALSNGSLEVVEASMHRLLDEISKSKDPDKIMKIYTEAVNTMTRATSVMDKIKKFAKDKKVIFTK